MQIRKQKMLFNFTSKHSAWKWLQLTSVDIEGKKILPVCPNYHRHEANP
jgi:hypothetical protein